MRRTALVVGAGIGCLSAAISLRQAGWHVRVFERAASVRELGFALLVAPNAMAALRELGVADVVLARGVPPTRGEARRMDGAILKRADFPLGVSPKQINHSRRIWVAGCSSTRHEMRRV